MATEPVMMMMMMMMMMMAMVMMIDIPGADCWNRARPLFAWVCFRYFDDSTFRTIFHGIVKSFIHSVNIRPIFRRKVQTLDAARRGYAQFR